MISRLICVKIDVPGRATFNSDIGDGSDVHIPMIELGSEDFIAIQSIFVVEEPVFNITISYEGNSDNTLNEPRILY